MLGDLPKLGPLLDPGINRLHSLGIEPELFIAPGLNADQLDSFNDEFRVVLPTDLRELYHETDGFSVCWESDDDWGALEIPSLYGLRLYRQRWVNGGMPDRGWTDHLAEDEATEVLRSMRVWVPFEEFGGGNSMCVDCDSGRVVLYDYGWPTERNGVIYAVSLFDYIGSCSRICFHDVELAYFPRSVRDSEHFADWTRSEVPPKYIVAD